MSSPSRPISPLHRFFTTALLVFGWGLSLGCSPADGRPQAIGGTSVAGQRGSEHRTPREAKKCAPGDTRTCSHTMAQEPRILTCFRGVQTCQDDGQWGACGDGTVTTKESSYSLSLGSSLDKMAKGTLRLAALSSSDPGDCLDACDPRCEFFEEPSPSLGTPTSGGGGSSDFPGTAPSCDHGLCDTNDGDPLDASCDPCVATVCAVDPSCCSTTWDDTCADLVYTECEGTTPPLDLCDFGVFSINGVVTANRPSAGAAIGSAGDITIGTDATPGMIVTEGNLHINSPNGKSIVAPGGVWVGGSATAQNGGGAQYTADWHVGGGINLNGGNTINGDVYAGSNPSGVIITGNTYVPSPAPEIELPTEIPPLPSGCPGGSNYNVSNATRTLTPGDYGTVNLSNEAKLVLDGPGTYTFDVLNAGVTRGGIQIGTNAAPGTYEVIVCGDFRLGNNANIIDSSANPTNRGARTPVLASPERLVLYVGGNVQFGPDNNFTGVLIVPDGKYTAGDRSRVNGAVWARDFQTGTDMNAVQIDSAACEALELTGGARECPVVDVGLPAATNEPCETGADCQMNQRCEEVVTNSCDHAKCAPGAALEPSCDRCVDMICDVDPSCCTTAWTEACVEMVSTVCDASCGAVTGCTHDMCEVGGSLQQDCDTESCTDSVCSNPSYAYCCDDSDPRGWDQGCVDRVLATCSGTPSGMGGGAMCGYAVHHGTGISGSANLSGGTLGTGGVVEERSFSCGSGSSTYGTTTLSPGTFGDVSLNDWSGATLSLNAGTYYVKSLTIGSGTTLRLPASGKVVINVCGDVRLNRGARVTGLSSGNDQLRLELYTNGDFDAGNDVDLQGVILVGDAASSTTLSGPTVHEGLLWSNGSVAMVNAWGQNPTVANSISPAACEAANLVAPACPVTTAAPVVQETGSCVSNEDGWEEPYCAGFDLAAGYVCANEVPICNHGTSAFPGGDITVGHWAIADRQFATKSPNVSLGGSCTETMPAIAPGSCASMPCSLPLGTDYTLMIDPVGVLGECDDHRLDNWTWRDDDYACGGGTSFAEYEYEAECPEGTSPLWKNLTWVSSVPSGSAIDFAGKVAGDMSELSTKTYVDLGRAEQGAADTTTCDLGGSTPGCPIGITETMDLGASQGQFFSLRVDADHAGGTPSVSDWAISYTCRDDE